MLGAVIGDIAGSRFEWKNTKSKEFELFTPECRITDDSVMTLAIARAILDSAGRRDRLGAEAVRCMQSFGRRWARGCYGGSFARWLLADAPRPYGSWGNGSAMRVSACAWAAQSLKEALDMARIVTAVTHDHPEGIKGALAVTALNADRLRAKLTLHQGDLFNSITEGMQFDVIVSNPPYIPAADCLELQEEVRREPMMALDGGADGYDFYRRIAQDAPHFLKEGGVLLMEVGFDQAQGVMALCREAGFRTVLAHEDYQHIERMVEARL